MRRVSLFLAAMIALSLPVFAVAQNIDDLDRYANDIQTGTRFKLQAETPNAGKSREMQKTIARCITYRNKDLVREILAKSDPSRIAYSELSVDIGELTEELNVSACMSRAMSAFTIRLHMRFNYQTFRNLFAEEVYLMDVKDPLIISQNEAETLENRNFVGGFASPMTQAMATMADCFSYRATAEAHAFLRTRPGTRSEREAVDAFLPVAAPCLGGGAEAQEMEVDISMVRKIVADGLWSRHHYRTNAAEENAGATE